jgi:hypothetical protein
MVLTYNRSEKSVKIDIERYIGECLKDFEEEEPNEILKEVKRPAASSLF